MTHVPSLPLIFGFKTKNSPRSLKQAPSQNVWALVRLDRKVEERQVMPLSQGKVPCRFPLFTIIWHPGGWRSDYRLPHPLFSPPYILQAGKNNWKQKSQARSQQIPSQYLKKAGECLMNKRLSVSYAMLKIIILKLKKKR